MKENNQSIFNTPNNHMGAQENLHTSSRRAQDVMEVGECIRQCRKDAGISQEKLAELSGHTNNTIHRAEIGMAIIGIDTFFAIADALKVPIEELCPKRFSYIKRRSDLIDLVFHYGRLSDENQKVVYETVMTLMKGLIVKQRESK